MGIDLETAHIIKELGIAITTVIASLFFIWKFAQMNQTTTTKEISRAQEDRKDSAHRMDVQADQFFDELKNQAARCQEELAEVRLMQKQERAEWMEQSTKERIEWIRKISEMHETQIKAINELSELIRKLL